MIRSIPTEDTNQCKAPTDGVRRRSRCSPGAPARARAKSPESRIAFPLEASIARQQFAQAPHPCQFAQALRDRSPPARLFTQSGDMLGGKPCLSSAAPSVFPKVDDEIVLRGGNCELNVQ